MKIWVADELGQIKSCTVENTAVEGNALFSDTQPVSSSECHDRSDYVQIMAHAKWEASGKSLVSVQLFIKPVC
jgi:hypothetical protein